MSIRPIDMQVIVHRSSEVSRTANEVRPEVAQQFADQFKKEVVHNDQHVVQLNKSEQNNVNKDGKGNASYQKNKDAKKQGKDSKNDKPKLSDGSSFYDVTI